MTDQPVLYIMVDSNPNIGMGYMVLGNDNLLQNNLSDIIPESTQILSKLPPEFQKMFDLEKEINSTFFELKGLLCFTHFNRKEILKLRKKISQIVFVCDNTEVLNINKGFSTNPLIKSLQMTFLKVLDDLNTAWSSTWLRRSTKVISRADEKGRVTLIHLNSTFFEMNQEISCQKIHVDPLLDNFKNWVKFIFLDTPQEH